ncbi:hypothetical protein GP486_008253 [Trichoglossum hirsutum]|uniref:Uncharacterized protein n=1 Tax=Trichoglossum hirsutum TaxID=265104 RepID=A0A9P8IEB7_9PEZI|nr:hypothetical protein GP486_008253 [Trichoglossum hirsutum]
MIADLKADSARWEAERREGEARGYPTVYRTSVVHQSRQFYGPSEGQQPPPGVAPTGAVFVGQAPPGPTTYGAGYDQQAAAQYPPSTAGYSSGNYAYASGGNYAPESQPRYPYQPADTPGYDSARGPDSYNSAYGGAPVAGPGPTAPRQNPPSFQPRDPSYGRGGYNYPNQ